MTTPQQSPQPREHRTPRDVFMRLVEGVAAEHWHELPDLYAERTNVRHPFDPSRAPAIRTRDELREHFTPPPGGLGIKRQATNFTIHETADPEVIVAEFEYHGTTLATGGTFVVPCIFVIRVRDGQIIESRDYIDHVASARARGTLEQLRAVLRAPDC